MATLKGWKVPTLWGLADHTYATSDQGDAWGCWGRSSGGTAISQGQGNVNEARCIAWPNSTAGLIYGVTGVCHQTANRILYPASITVSAAKGYWLSSSVYGAYGTDTLTWLARLAYCTIRY